ncbi:hypothetical protein C7999DRAFT_11535 [Corynascus novoguineensis]|uniref:Malate dehydrogenase n=1 Tax=Corynascus novoguineensis TaxID=1126955 RepID=A0AAN7CYL4_9PEZI|nr:hypothetical protein C7999DRAFT_11535 [Corynascus novoguineensis]
MHASLFFVPALAASVWAAPTYPMLDRAARLPDSISVISEYFNLLASKVQESRLLDIPPACDLSQIPQPAGAADLPSPSPGLSLRHIAIGRGTQNYTCDAATPDAAPQAAGAVATLFNASCLVAVSPDLAAALTRAALHFDLSQSISRGGIGNGKGWGSLAPSNLAPSGLHFFADATTALFKLDVSPDLQLGELPCGKNASVPAPPSDAASSRGLGGEPPVAWLKLNAKSGATGGLQEVYRFQTVGGSAPATCHGMPEEFQVQYAAQ